MAQCVQFVEEFVQDSFVPMVAVLCSEEAERATRKNNLNFTELLRPFCRLTSEGHIRDPNNQLQVVKNLRICVNNVMTNPNTASAALSPAQRRLLNEVVLSCQPQEGAVTNVITAGDYNLNFNDHSLKASTPWYSAWREALLEVSTSQHYTATTPWFKAYRENFLQTMPASDHEFLNHYLACILSTAYDDYQNVLYEDMKQRYGAQGCYLLKINSRASSTAEDEQIPDPWSQYLHRNNLQNQVILPAVFDNQHFRPKQYFAGHNANGVSNSLESHPLQLDEGSGMGALHTLSAANTDVKKGARDPESTAGGAGSHGVCLTLNDHDHIRQFIQEFTFRGLLPHIEKNIRQLNDQLVSRKGLSRSLFTATKKWFGGGKGPEKSVHEPKSTCGLLYPPEAPELQIRKMADLCFLVQHYELAYSCYHTAKKDFLSDQAMLYAAGALEMAAVSAFLHAGAARSYPAHYMDTAIQTYRDVCKNMVLAERCTLLSAEILKSQGKYSEAATLLIKMTSEDSDLRSALLLEQAAHCFINMRNPMVRKFAFHMILAGHRFSKAGQRRHALRCYCQAMQVYKERGWALAEDHINFTIGRQSFTLRQPENAVLAFKQILTNDSRQMATQQAAFLREYLYVYKVTKVFNHVSSLPMLPLPCIHSSATRVYFGHERRLAEGEKQAATHVSLDQDYDQDLAAMWCHLEEQLVASANRGTVPVNFQQTQCCLNSQTDNLRHPLAVVEEPMIVELTFRNPLKVSLALSNLSLLWRFTPDAASPSKEKMPEEFMGETITNEETLALGVGQQTANLMVVRGKQDLMIQGPRLNQTKEDKMLVRHGPDRRLDPIITPNMPLMEVFFLHFPTALLCGEIRKAYVEFCNVSSVALSGLRVASTHPDFFTFGSQATTPVTPLSPTSAKNCSAYKTLATVNQPGSVAFEVLVSAEDFSQLSTVVEIPIEGNVLEPGESTQLPLWLRGPDQEGVHEINFLFYYESVEKGTKISHRVLRHTVFICASRSLSVQASASRSSVPPHHCQDDKGCSGTLVVIDVENINTSESGVREFHIVQVSSSSQHWQLHKCINPARDKDCKLTSRERAKLCFRAKRCKPHQGSSYRKKHNHHLKSQDPSEDKASDLNNIVKKCNELDLNIIVIWKAFVVEDNKQLILEGQLHVALQTIGKEDFSLVFLLPKCLCGHVLLFQEAQEMVLLKFKSEQPPPVVVPSAELSQLIKTNLHYPETYTHPFVQNSLCLVPVTLTLSNCSPAHVDIIVDLRHKSTSPESLEVHNSFNWVGQTQYKLQLRPEEVLCLTLQACFIQAGVYNLNTPRVFAKPAEQGTMCETSQQTSSPALIIINNA
uniref:Trafficking protein particle complex 8 n=1 Tax=Echeneis naucrates TaxID=173247 RepID=A0A665T8C6_ECHNA